MWPEQQKNELFSQNVRLKVLGLSVEYIQIIIVTIIITITLAVNTYELYSEFQTLGNFLNLNLIQSFPLQSPTSMKFRDSQIG